MKKKIAVILCVALCLTTLFGCSSAELGYLNMNSDMSKIKSYQFSGDTEIYYDAEAIKEFVLKNTKDQDEKAELEEDFDKFTGKKKIAISYDGTGQISDGNMEYHTDVTASIDGKKTHLGDIYISTTDGIYAERDMIINLYNLSKDVFVGYEDSYFYSENYEKELREALGNSEYIEIFSAEDCNDIFGVQNGNLYFATANNEYYDQTIKFMKNAFKGYTSDVVSSVSGGYKISVSGEDMIKIASECLEYVSNNLDDGINAFKEYSKFIITMMDEANQLDGVDKEEVNSILDYEISEDDRLKIASGIAGAKFMLDYMKQSGELDLVKPFSYNQTIKKFGKSYTVENIVSMDEGRKNLGYIKAKSKITPKTINLDIPKTGTQLADIKKNIEALEAKYNPVKKVEITWEKSRGVEAEEDEYWEDDWNYCDIYGIREFEMPLTSKDTYDWCDYKNVNKEMYIPLRQICEYFGEEIGWDNNAKKAYIVKDNDKVFIKGILDTKTTFVRIRDFEKLGYNVTYDGSDSLLHLVTIEKK